MNFKKIYRIVPLGIMLLLHFFLFFLEIRNFFFHFVKGAHNVLHVRWGVGISGGGKTLITFLSGSTTIILTKKREKKKCIFWNSQFAILFPFYFFCLDANQLLRVRRPKRKEKRNHYFFFEVPYYKKQIIFPSIKFCGIINKTSKPGI